MKHIAWVIFLIIVMNGMAVLSLDWQGWPNGITGAQVSSVTGNVSFTVLQGDFCEINFGEGWNLVSVCSNVSNTNITSVFDDIQGNIRFILEWDDAAQQFAVFSPLQSNPPFTTINLSKSYFVFYDNATNTTQSFTQNPFGNLNLSLVQQFNTPTYPYEFPANVSTYITPIANETNFVLKWNQSAQAFVAFSPLAATPQFEVIGAGDGQFILISAAGGANLFYDRSALDASI